jgi:hypothetical protein
LVATISGDNGILVDWEVREKDRHVAGGNVEIGTSAKGVYSGKLVERGIAGLEAGRTYEVRFGVCGSFSVSRWFRFKSERAAGSLSVPRPGSSGFNSLDNAFKGIFLFEEKKGGEP